MDRWCIAETCGLISEWLGVMAAKGAQVKGRIEREDIGRRWNVGGGRKDGRYVDGGSSQQLRTTTVFEPVLFVELRSRYNSRKLWVDDGWDEMQAASPRLSVMHSVETRGGIGTLRYT